MMSEFTQEEQTDLHNFPANRQASLSSSLIEASSSYAYLWQSNEERNAHDLYVLQETEKLVKQLCHRLCAALKESCYIHCANEISHELCEADNMEMLSTAGLLEYFKEVNYTAYLEYIQRVSHANNTQVARSFVMCVTDNLVDYFLELYVNPLIRHLRDMINNCVIDNSSNKNIKTNVQERKERKESTAQKEVAENDNNNRNNRNNNNNNNNKSGSKRSSLSSANKHHKCSVKSTEPVASIIFDDSVTTLKTTTTTTEKEKENEANKSNNKSICCNSSRQCHNNNAEIKNMKRDEILEICHKNKEEEKQLENVSEPINITLAGDLTDHHHSESINGTVRGDKWELSETLYSECEGNVQKNDHNLSSSNINNNNNHINVMNSNIITTTSNSSNSNNDENETEVWKEIKSNLAQMLHLQNEQSLEAEEQINIHNATLKHNVYFNILHSFEMVLCNRQWHDMYDSVLCYAFAQLYLYVVKRFGLILRLKLMEYYDGESKSDNYLNSEKELTSFSKTNSENRNNTNTNSNNNNNTVSKGVEEQTRCKAECMSLLDDVLRDCIDEHYHNSTVQLKKFTKQQKLDLLDAIHKYYKHESEKHQNRSKSHITTNTITTYNNNNNKTDFVNDKHDIMLDEVFAKDKLVYNIWKKHSSNNNNTDGNNDNNNINNNSNNNDNSNNLQDVKSSKMSKQQNKVKKSSDDSSSNSSSDIRSNNSKVACDSATRLIRSASANYSGNRSRINYKLTSASSAVVATTAQELSNKHNTINNENNNNNNNNHNIAEEVVINSTIEPSTFSDKESRSTSSSSELLFLDYWLQNLYLLAQKYKTRYTSEVCSDSHRKLLATGMNGAKVLEKIFGSAEKEHNNKDNIIKKCVLVDITRDAELYDALTSSAFDRVCALQNLVHSNANRLFVALMNDRLAALLRERDVREKLQLPPIETNIKDITVNSNLKTTSKTKKSMQEQLEYQLLEQKKEERREDTLEGSAQLKGGKGKNSNLEERINTNNKSDEVSKHNSHMLRSFTSSTVSMRSARTNSSSTRNHSVTNNNIIQNALEKEKLESNCQCVLM